MNFSFFLTSLNLISLFFLFGTVCSKYLKKFKYGINYSGNSNEEFSIVFTELSLGAIFTFLFLSGINIITHIYGLSSNSNLQLITFILIVSIFSKSELKKFIFSSFKLIRENLKFKLYYRARLNYFIYICLFICLINIFYRMFLPIGNSDQIGKYFYDALQISKLNSISLKDFYQLNQSLTTESVASFFDALILQNSNSWLLTRITRLISLILIIGLANEIANYYGKISFNRSLLLIVIILSQADIWTLAISGKHDIYICLLEMVIFRLFMIYKITYEKKYKSSLLKIAFILATISLFSRMSSLALFVVLLLFILREYKLKKNIFKFISFQNLIFIMIMFLTIYIFGHIGILNYIYNNNPFYIISPPVFLKYFFKDAKYVYDLNEFRSILNLQNIPAILYPFSVAIYSFLGIEQIRYFLFRISDLLPFTRSLYSFISYYGPSAMLRSIFGFSPFGLFAFYSLKEKSKRLMIIFLICWLFIWSLGITYTRTALAMSILFSSYGIVELNSQRNLLIFKKNFSTLFKNLLIIFALSNTLLLSVWGIYNLKYQPSIKSIVTIPYDRKALTKEFILMLNRTQDQEKKIPSDIFLRNWESILEKENKKSTSILIGAPKPFAYFINHGVIMTNISEEKMNSLKNKKIDFYKLLGEEDFVRVR